MLTNIVIGYFLVNSLQDCEILSKWNAGVLTIYISMEIELF